MTNMSLRGFAERTGAFLILQFVFRHDESLWSGMTRLERGHGATTCQASDCGLLTKASTRRAE